MSTAQRSFPNIGPLHTVRKRMLLGGGVLLAIFLFFGDSRWGETVHETVEWLGLFLIFVSIAGRSWCTIYIGGSKRGRLVTDGPYSVTRNPLYLFSVVGAVGVGAQVGSLTIGLAAALFAWMIFYLTALKEERTLESAFGPAYREYVARVPRFWPRMKDWRSAEVVEVRPAFVVRTFLDACVFLLAIPVAESFEYLHEIGALPVLFRLP
jgi:protein-S-isoprenylcysteine O-methyltransferase Ste14